jgi:hypothetical protein
MKTITRLVLIGMALTLLAVAFGHAQGRRSRAYRGRRSETSGLATTRAGNATQAGSATTTGTTIATVAATTTTATGAATATTTTTTTGTTNATATIATATNATTTTVTGKTTATVANATMDKDFQRFGIIMQRNIFNKNRVRPLTPEELAAATAPVQAQPTIQNIDLIGTWIFDQRKVAFVQGDQAMPGGQASLGDALGGWKIATITTDGVTLTKNNAQAAMRVGQRLERAGQGEWQVVDGLARSSAAVATRKSLGTTTNANASNNAGSNERRGNRGTDSSGGANGPGNMGGPGGPGGPGDMGGPGGSAASQGGATNTAASSASSADTLRRMMQRRQQEMGGGR